jgi:metal-sulfur cluster biosynthetic enzyme
MSTARADEVQARLDRVTDPELDEPVTALGFVTSVEVAGDEVRVGFRLPTYWCAANFAYLMADDMRREIAALPWVRRVRIELGEHMYAETINRGLNDGRSFDETFTGAACGEIEAVRRAFLGKSFQRRQEHVLTALRAASHTDQAIVALQVKELRGLADETADAYLRRRDVPGPFLEDDPAFVTVEGDPVQAPALGLYLRRLRNVAVNIEFNGALCRGLLAARFDEEQPDEQGPSFRHFLREAVRAHS